MHKISSEQHLIAPLQFSALNLKKKKAYLFHEFPFIQLPLTPIQQGAVFS